MSDRVRRPRAAWTAATAAVLSAALSGVLSAVLSVATTATAVAQAVEDIRDIRGPKFTLPPWLLPAVIAGAVLLAFGGFRLWRRLRRRRQPRVLLPFEVALQRLEEMRALMQPDDAREFSIAVSDVVRRYIEERFGATATHRTTEEFLHDLLESSHAPLARHRALLSEFLQACDLVKFAGMSLTLQNMESLHHSARAFVLETAKPDEPVAGGAPPAPETAHA
jgi:ABC-type nickel/cobalt efflux system permease component RcnA